MDPYQPPVDCGDQKADWKNTVFNIVQYVFYTVDFLVIAALFPLMVLYVLIFQVYLERVSPHDELIENVLNIVSLLAWLSIVVYL